MRRLVFVLNGALPEETIHWKKVSENDYLVPCIQKSSFLRSSLTDDQRKVMVKDYYKFTIIRNPLERLLSAFRNKIEPPLDNAMVNSDLFHRLRKQILMRYRKDSITSHGTASLRVKFAEYIRWIIDERNDAINEHFSPVIDNIYPCRIRYDFYGNFKQLGADVARIMDKLHASYEYFRNSSYHRPGEETKDYLEQYYSQLDRDLKYRLFEDFRQELDFYYHLYPEERNSHIAFLGVDKDV